MSMVIQKRRGLRLNNGFFAALLLAVSIAVQPFYNAAQAVETPQYNNVAFTTSELANWSPDRTAPSISHSVSFEDRENVLEMNINTEAQSTKGAFYYTEGLQRDIPASDSVKADVYIDSSWQGNQTRAGLWGIAKSTSGAITAYPIVEFTTATEAGHVGWRTYDSIGDTSHWVNLDTPFIWNSWNTLALTLNKTTHKFDVSINGTVVASNSYNETNASLNAVILNSKNYGTLGQDYSARWSNFGYGAVIDVQNPPTLTVTTPSQGAAVSTKANGNKLTVKGSFTDDVTANYANLQLVYRGNLVSNETFYGFGPVYNPAATYANADGTYTYDLSVPATAENGTYDLFYVGTDFDGNVTERMKRTIVIDNVNPSVVFTNPDNNETVNDLAVSVQMDGTGSNLTQYGFDITGPNGTAFHTPSQTVDKPTVSLTNFDLCANSHTVYHCPAVLPDGQYTVRAKAYDKATNRNISTYLKLNYVNPVTPVLNAEDFGVGFWTLATDKFTGFNVGFNIADFASVSGVSVDVYGENGHVSNTATPTYLSLINSQHWSQLSSPFKVDGVLNDTWCDGGPCWNMGESIWTSSNKPVRAVITVNGTSLGGKTVTKTAENTTFSEAAASFASILPAPVRDVLGAVSNAPTSGPAAPVLSAPVSPQLPSSASLQHRPMFSYDTSNVGNTASNDTLATVAEAQETTMQSTPSVLGTTDSLDNLAQVDMSNEDSEGGLLKYWWIPTSLLVVVLGWWLTAALGRHKNEND